MTTRSRPLVPAEPWLRAAATTFSVFTLVAVVVAALRGGSALAALATAIVVGIAGALTLWVQVALLVRWQSRTGRRIARGFGRGLMWGEHFTTGR